MQRATAQKDVKRVVKSRGYAAGVRVHPGGKKVKDDATYYFQYDDVTMTSYPTIMT